MSFTLDKKFPETVYRAAYPGTIQHSRKQKIPELKGVKVPVEDTSIPS
jgi:hypothetical protein